MYSYIYAVANGPNQHKPNKYNGPGICPLRKHESGMTWNLKYIRF